MRLTERELIDLIAAIDWYQTHLLDQYTQVSGEDRFSLQTSIKRVRYIQEKLLYEIDSVEESSWNN